MPDSTGCQRCWLCHRPLRSHEYEKGLCGPCEGMLSDDDANPLLDEDMQADVDAMNAEGRALTATRR
jgi:hypothetical protein